MSSLGQATSLAIALVGLAAPASADPLSLRIQTREQPLFLQHAWHRAVNPNVTPDNPMGIVGWDGPPDDVPSVSGDAGPMAPGSIANAPFEGYSTY
ncbi:hypothetical protein [Methylobacterium sp. NEAU K]|uniref:hypothetical protein n=1 Tax=Methylobacterium sp. NEAU K TaxID=3064946 RepID=UPI0027344B25|nr:hypothetical protein [Methylobacterium sp. NEAU K]MDP4002189.1 hypothetical protein [Methylobacterium sp. NEAU K]